MAPLPDPWPAPYAHTPVSATVAVPGSKSVTARALILAALADGPSVLREPLVSRDTDLMRDALTALGARFSMHGDELHATPLTPLDTATVRIECGLAGTVMRFSPPLAALTRGVVLFDGDAHARKRPVQPLLKALSDLGVEISATDGTLPFEVVGRGELPGGEVEIDASASSQFISALLLAGARSVSGISISHTGQKLPSTPHLEMTCSMLREAGVSIAHPDARTWRVEAGPIRARDWRIEPDLSNAAPFLAAAVLTGGQVRVSHWPEQTTQPGDQLRKILPAMGAIVERDENTLVVRGTREVHGLDADLSHVGELTPVLAAIAAAAQTPSHFYGIGHLRGHETDRLRAISTELRRVGASVEEHADGIRITPRTLHPAQLRTYGDHRMAHAAAVLGLVNEGITVENIGTTSKTMPEFPQLWQRTVAGASA